MVLEFLCAKLSITTLFLMAVVTFADVLGRVVFNAPLGFAFELVGILLSISFYAGLYHVHKTSKHIRIDLFEKLFRGRLGVVVFWFGYLVEVIFFTALIVMVYQTMQETRKLGETFLFLTFDKWYAIGGMFVLALIAYVSLLVTTPEARVLQLPPLRKKNEESI